MHHAEPRFPSLSPLCPPLGDLFYVFIRQAQRPCLVGELRFPYTLSLA